MLQSTLWKKRDVRGHLWEFLSSLRKWRDVSRWITSVVFTRSDNRTVRLHPDIFTVIFLLDGSAGVDIWSEMLLKAVPLTTFNSTLFMMTFRWWYLKRWQVHAEHSGAVSFSNLRCFFPPFFGGVVRHHYNNVKIANSSEWCHSGSVQFFYSVYEQLSLVS